MKQTRRANGEGSIRQRADGYFEARVTLADGSRKSVYGKTREEVLRKKHELEHADDHGLPILDERQTVEQYLTSWYEMVKPQLKASSLRPYRNDIELRLVPYLGKIPLAKLSAQQVQLLYGRLIDLGSSPKTVGDCHGVLHHALDDAVRMGVVMRNVADVVTPPRKVPPQFHILEVQEVQRFLQTVQGDRFEALYILALTTGMREGELLGLRWHDIDLEHHRLQVHMAVTETDDNRFVLAEPKTVYSRRTVALTDVAVAAVIEHQAKQLAEAQQLGDMWHNDDNLVFPNGFGTIMIPHNITKRSFKRLLVKAGLPRSVRFHDLRHTAASLLLMAGVNVKVVSEMLGHSSITITLSIYAHVMPHMQQSAVSAMELLLGAPLASHEPGKIEPILGQLGYELG